MPYRRSSTYALPTDTMEMRHGGDEVGVWMGVGCGYPEMSRAWWVAGIAID